MVLTLAPSTGILFDFDSNSNPKIAIILKGGFRNLNRGCLLGRPAGLPLTPLAKA
jgi:hypothetical protein